MTGGQASSALCPARTCSYDRELSDTLKNRGSALQGVGPCMSVDATRRRPLCIGIRAKE
jgi:hypothetical protein